MSHKCTCSQMPEILYYEDTTISFRQDLDKIETGGWIELHKCRICGQCWQIDVWDQGQERFVAKIEDIKNWKVFDISPLVKNLIIKNRGGTTDQECVWANCKNKRVKGVAYCINHLYENGARR